MTHAGTEDRGWRLATAQPIIQVPVIAGGNVSKFGPAAIATRVARTAPLIRDSFSLIFAPEIVDGLIVGRIGFNNREIAGRAAVVVIGLES